MREEHLSLASEPAARSYSSRGTKVGRLSQVSKQMIKTALNVSGHHSHTGQSPAKDCNGEGVRVRAEKTTEGFLGSQR